MRIKNTDTYLRKLEEELIELPKKERKAIVAEIEDHFSNEIMEQIHQGKSKEDAEWNVIHQFKSPKDLAEAYVTTSSQSNFDQLTVSFFVINLWVAGSGGLLAQLLDIYNLGGLTAGILAVTISIIHLFFKKDWRKLEVQALYYFKCLIPFFLFPASLFMFWLHGEINTYTTTYLVSYWVFIGFSYRLSQWFYKRALN
ncbi:hypothetical protein J32TS6_33330 [Virgibacillus pantothenticus]|uniref:DUF1700 domain-containing protein n=1 Tax=Virgibacillus pantothenticus TaxID=1473 RepID=UPI001B25B1DC|nr:DUF1700 domain-containing protein [Virgibacillus pantothenticus]GIP64778.1 hypothetical protein J32TS6_33330 [Virgibacillus pantothenticus]